jgi:hypothetical protein
MSAKSVATPSTSAAPKENAAGEAERGRSALRKLDADQGKKAQEAAKEAAAQPTGPAPGQPAETAEKHEADLTVTPGGEPVKPAAAKPTAAPSRLAAPSAPAAEAAKDVAQLARADQPGAPAVPRA